MTKGKSWLHSEGTDIFIKENKLVCMLPAYSTLHEVHFRKDHFVQMSSPARLVVADSGLRQFERVVQSVGTDHVSSKPRDELASL